MDYFFIAGITTALVMLLLSWFGRSRVKATTISVDAYYAVKADLAQSHRDYRGLALVYLKALVERSKGYNVKRTLAQYLYRNEPEQCWTIRECDLVLGGVSPAQLKKFLGL